MGWSGSIATLGRKLGCLKEDLSPVHEEVPERWGAVGGLGGPVVCLAGLQAGQARLPSPSLLGRRAGQGVRFQASGQQAGGPSQVGTAECGWGGWGRRGRRGRTRGERKSAEWRVRVSEAHVAPRRGWTSY